MGSKVPANFSSCENVLSRGWRYGDCSWSHSSWDGAGNGTTEKDYCICYRNVGDWQCTKNIETTTRPRTATSPPPVTVASSAIPATTIPPTQQQPGRRKVTTASSDNDDSSTFCP